MSGQSTEKLPDSHHNPHVEEGARTLDKDLIEHADITSQRSDDGEFVGRQPSSAGTGEEENAQVKTMVLQKCEGGAENGRPVETKPMASETTFIGENSSQVASISVVSAPEPPTDGTSSKHPEQEGAEKGKPELVITSHTPKEEKEEDGGLPNAKDSQELEDVREKEEGEWVDILGNGQLMKKVMYS